MSIDGDIAKFSGNAGAVVARYDNILNILTVCIGSRGECKSMRVLVTGAMGNLGLMLVAALERRGYAVRCCDLDNRRNRAQACRLPENVEFLWGDIRDRQAVVEAVAGVDAVIHLAAVLPPITDQQPKLADDINIDGTRYLVEALQDRAGKVVFIYSSSVTVFGLQQD